MEAEIEHSISLTNGTRSNNSHIKVAFHFHLSLNIINMFISQIFTTMTKQSNKQHKYMTHVFPI